MTSPEIRQRLTALRAGLSAQNIDALLVSHPANVLYLSGFTGSNGLLVITPDSHTLITDPRYTTQAAQETRAKVVIARHPILQAALRVLKRKSLRTVGYEGDHLLHSTFEILRDGLGLGVSLKSVGDLLSRLRLVKSADEIELIRQSVLANSKALQRASKSFRVGATENDLAAEIDYQMRRAGAQGTAFDTIVAAGDRSALPHAHPTDKVLAANELLLIDMGATRSAYTSDMTRMFHLGRPSRKARELYAAVLEAQLASIDVLREGVTAQAVDRAGRRVLQQHGLEKQFVHSTGHGLGLEIHEAPRLGKKDKTRLQAGMVVTIEPGVYLEDFGGIRIEDTVLVTKTGCEVLTPTSKELVVI